MLSPGLELKTILFQFSTKGMIRFNFCTPYQQERHSTPPRVGANIIDGLIAFLLCYTMLHQMLKLARVKSQGIQQVVYVNFPSFHYLNDTEEAVDTYTSYYRDNTGRSREQMFLRGLHDKLFTFSRSITEY
jgi:hypothetical protein